MTKKLNVLSFMGTSEQKEAQKCFLTTDIALWQIGISETNKGHFLLFPTDKNIQSADDSLNKVRFICLGDFNTYLESFDKNPSNHSCLANLRSIFGNTPYFLKYYEMQEHDFLPQFDAIMTHIKQRLDKEIFSKRKNP